MSLPGWFSLDQTLVEVGWLVGQCHSWCLRGCCANQTTLGDLSEWGYPPRHKGIKLMTPENNRISKVQNKALVQHHCLNAERSAKLPVADQFKGLKQAYALPCSSKPSYSVCLCRPPPRVSVFWNSASITGVYGQLLSQQPHSACRITTVSK